MSEAFDYRPVARLLVPLMALSPAERRVMDLLVDHFNEVVLLDCLFVEAFPKLETRFPLDRDGLVLKLIAPLRWKVKPLGLAIYDYFPPPARLEAVP